MTEPSTELAPPIASADAGFLALIERAARDPAVDVAKMQALLDMQREIVRDRAQAAFNEAFALMAPKLPRIRQDSGVEYSGKKAFRYASWEAIDVAIRPLLNEHWFSLSFDTAPVAAGIVVTGTLLHAAGHSRSASIALPFDPSGGKNGLQAVASAFSYGKRYTATMLLNIVTEGDDDDGQRGGTQYIDLPAKQQITRLLQETKSDLPRFLRYVGASSVDEIQVKDFDRAIFALETKQQKQAAGNGVRRG